MTITLRRAPPIRIAERAILLPGDARTRTAPNGESFDHKFIASTELIASDHGVIYVDAWDVQRYMKRPRWIAAHDLGGWTGKLNEVALGRAVFAGKETGLPTDRVGPTGKALTVFVRYASTPFAQEVRTLYEEGGLDDVSVRWDPRTEVVRAPYQEEVARFGEDLSWVATYVELVELSAVMLGADAGAQVVRSGVEEAFERCRSKKIRLPEVERLIRGRKPPIITVSRDEQMPDILAAAEALDSVKTTVAALGDWHGAAVLLRQELADGLTAVQNLAEASTSGSDEEPGDPEVAAALGAVNEAHGDFDVWLRNGGSLIAAIGNAWGQVGDVLGLGQIATQGPDGRKLSIDVPAVLADARRSDSTLTRAWQAYQKVNA